jgi:hypothetical protein
VPTLLPNDHIFGDIVAILINILGSVLLLDAFKVLKWKDTMKIKYCISKSKRIFPTYAAFNEIDQIFIVGEPLVAQNCV